MGEPDPDHPIGVTGIGEISRVGVGLAIADGAHHATGRRIPLAADHEQPALPHERPS